MQGHDGVASYSWLGDLGVACAGEAGLTWPSRAASGVETAMPIAKPELVNETLKAPAGSSRSNSPSLPNSTCFWIGRHISLTGGSKVDVRYV
jgi:hypothetical protein